MNNILELQKLENLENENAQKSFSTLSVMDCQNGGGN